MTTPDDVLVDASMAANSGWGPVPQEAPPAPPAPAQPQEQAPVDIAPKEFDPRWRDPFFGLVYLGRLTETFTIWGHEFRITTPSHLERMEIGLVHAPYANSLATEIAYSTAMVAAYLQTVDGQELPKPISPDPKDMALQERFRWVSKSLHRQVIDTIYNRCLVLDEQVEKVLDAMGEA